MDLFVQSSHHELRVRGRKKNTRVRKREFQKALSFTTVFFLSLLQTSVSEARQAMRGFHSNGAQITLTANMQILQERRVTASDRHRLRNKYGSFHHNADPQTHNINDLHK